MPEPLAPDDIDGDWRMLIDEEPIDAGNRIYTFRAGLVLDADEIEAGTYSAAGVGGYRVTIGEMVCGVRPVGGGGGTGAIATLSGSIDHGGWSDPVTFSRVKFDLRPPYGRD